MAAFSSPLASRGVDGRHHDQARHVGEVVLEGLGVGCRQLAPARRGPDHHRHGHLAAEHVVQLGGVVDDLVQRQQD